MILMVLPWKYGVCAVASEFQRRKTSKPKLILIIGHPPRDGISEPTSPDKNSLTRSGLHCIGHERNIAKRALRKIDFPMFGTPSLNLFMPLAKFVIFDFSRAPCLW
jgi:hypothetical protein